MNIGIVGCGTIGAILARHVAAKHKVTLFSRSDARALAIETKGKVATDLKQLLADCDVVFLAVKPDQLDAVAKASDGAWSERHLVVSVLGGVGSDILSSLMAPARIVRAMPNTPMAIGKGSIGLVRSDTHKLEDRDLAAGLLTGLGSLHWIYEAQMEAFTALAGCGPGMVFTLLEALVEGGIYLGLPARDAQKFACEMMAGAAEMALRSDESLCKLRWNVCSPGGSTIAGIKELEDLGVRAGLMNALIAAYNRSGNK